MSEIPQRVHRGQKFTPTATALNAIVDSSEWIRQKQQSTKAPTFQPDPLPPGVVLVKNDTDDDLPRGSILGINAPLRLPSTHPMEYRQEIALVGVTPTSSHAGKFCVLYEPIRAGGIGRAWIDGTPQVEIDVTSTSHKFAEVSTTTARLKSAVRGSAKILWAESGTGNKAAIVRLVAEQSGGDIYSEGASCGCCDPTHCASYTQPLSNSDCDEGPFGWEVNFGAAITLDAFCFGMPVEAGEAFELEYVGYGVWKSAAFTCLGAALVGGCNDEGGTAECCTGSAVMQPDGSSGWSEVTNDCSDGCTGQVPGSTSDGQSSVTVPCTDNVNYDIYISMDGFEWTRTGGNCEVHTVPDHVVYPPLDPGDIRQFPCCDSDPTLPAGDQYAWVQLTVNNTRDSENRSSTTLELIVGGVAAFTYVLPIGKDFCCTCEQKFELKCCGPWAFRFLPETVCLKPMAPGDFDDLYVDVPPGWQCCTPFEIGGIDKLPRFLTVTLRGTAGSCDSGCCPSLDGSWLLEWNDSFVQRWEFSIIGDQCLYDAICEDTTPCPGSVLGPNMANTNLSIRCGSISGSWFLIFEVYSCDFVSETSPECGGGGAAACGIEGCTTSNCGVTFMSIFPITANCFDGPIVFTEQGVPGGQMCIVEATALAVT